MEEEQRDVLVASELTIKWMCAGLIGCRSSKFRSVPAGPEPIDTHVSSTSEMNVDLVL